MKALLYFSVLALFFLFFFLSNERRDLVTACTLVACELAVHLRDTVRTLDLCWLVECKPFVRNRDGADELRLNGPAVILINISEDKRSRH